VRAGLRTSVLITIPFVLLLNSDQVVVDTHMYGDLSGIQRVRTVGDSSLARELRKWTREMTRGFDDAAFHTTGDNVVVGRNRQRNDLGAPNDVEAQALDIVQSPLSFVTTYTWSETVSIDFLGNDKEQAAAPHAKFEYRLTMPGSIRETTPSAEVNGRTAVWTLTAEQPEDGYVITATATHVRWDVIVVVVYVVGYLGFRLIAFLARRARLRPRKI